MSSSSIRAFIGLRLPEELSGQVSDMSTLLAAQDRGQMSWVAEENYHITLLFLGEQPQHWLEDLAERIDQEVDLSTQAIKIANIMPFPEATPKLLAAMLEPTDTLSRMHHQIKQSAKTMGFIAERRRFRPHITLARKFPRSGQFMIPTLSHHAEAVATELVIYESQLSASGAEYYPLFEFDLF